MNRFLWLSLFLTFFATALQAQLSEGFKQLQAGQLAEAKTSFSQARNSKTDSIPALWGLIQVLGNPAASKPNYDTAAILKNQLQVSLRKHKDSKDKKKWDKKYDLNDSEIKTYNKQLAEDHLKAADGSKDLPLLDSYLTHHKKNAPQKVKNKMSAQQQEALRIAVNGGADTYQELHYLLKKHRQTVKDSFPAQLPVLEQALFTSFMDNNGGQLDSLPKFDRENPDHTYVKHAARPPLATALKQHTAKALLQFINKYPETPFEPYIYLKFPSLGADSTPDPTLTTEEKILLEDIQSGMKNGVYIHCGDRFEGRSPEEWKAFVARHAGQSCGQRALRSMIQYYLKNRQWSDAENTLKALGGSFSSDSVWVNSLLKIVSAPDNNIRPVRLEGINSSGGEYVPTLTSDEQVLAFCGRSRPGSFSSEDIFICEKKGDGWDTPKLLKELSGAGNDAPMCFTADGQTLVLFKEGRIYLSDRTATGWSTPKNFPVNLSGFSWVSDVHFIPGEQGVFFTARTTSSFDDNDIYMAFKQDDGSWGKPQKLGAPINTSANDRSPFVHPDQRTLYFSSARDGGLGDLDVYKTVRLDDTWTRWSDPVNLGKNINTVGNNWGYIVTTEGSKAYYSARAEQGTSDDIYSIELPAEARPEAVKNLKVIVKDRQGKEQPNVQVQLRYTQSGITQSESRTDKSGKTTIYLPKNGDFTVAAVKQGYFSMPAAVDLSKPDATIELLIESLKEAGEGVKLFNTDILFDVAKSELKPEATAQIRFLADFAKREKAALELSGHTDPTGTDEENMALSKARAEAVRAALIQFGVPDTKVTAQGFGETKLVCTQNNPECYKKNRRVEVKIN